MANPTLIDLRTRVRANAKDDSATTANRSLSDAQINGWINLAFRRVQRQWVGGPRKIGRTATQTGLSYGASGYSDLTNEANYGAIRAAYVVQVVGDIYGVPLVRKEPEEFGYLRGGQSIDNTVAGSGTGVASTPIYYTAWREQTTTAADQGKWRVLIHPPSSTAVLVALVVEIEQADLSADADSPDVPLEACSEIEAIASYFASANLGRPWADSYLKMVPWFEEALKWETRDAGRTSTRDQRSGRA